LFDCVVFSVQVMITLLFDCVVFSVQVMMLCPMVLMQALRIYVKCSVGLLPRLPGQ